MHKGPSGGMQDKHSTSHCLIMTVGIIKVSAHDQQKLLHSRTHTQWATSNA